MEQFQLTQLEGQRTWTDQLKIWLPRIAAALLFFFIGLSKFGRQSRWITTFEQIGFGQWLRYATGILQLAGGVMVLVPRTFLLGIMMLAVTMLGAMIAWVFLLGAPFNALFPGALLIGLIVIAAEDLVELSQR
jgi:uncharacterized membrane protein YphA (DoxX/SURF4 family)